MALKKDGNMMNVVLWVLVFIGILYFFKPHVEELRAYLNDLVFPVKMGIYEATISTKGNLSKILTRRKCPKPCGASSAIPRYSSM